MPYLTIFLCCVQPPADVFARENIVAWCIVPFDAKKRDPAARMEMLQRLGISRYAYDWRDAHLPTFATELAEMQKRHIRLQAVWFPNSLNQDAQHLLTVLKKKQIKTDLWVSLPDPPGKNDEEKIAAALATLKPIRAAAQEAGCTVSLYNHGGWIGESEHQLAILKAAGDPKLGIIYNLHHGHHHLDRFAELFKTLQPHLRCLNLNGMVKDGDKKGMKIMPLGAGTEDLALLHIIRNANYTGPIGILGHEHSVDGLIQAAD